MQLISDTEPRSLNSQSPFHTQHSQEGGGQQSVRVDSQNILNMTAGPKQWVYCQITGLKLGWAWRGTARRTQENLKIAHSHPPEAGLEVLGKLLRIKT